MPSKRKTSKSKRARSKSTSARRKKTSNKRTARSKGSSKSVARRTPKKTASKRRRPRKSASVSPERELKQDIRSRNLGTPSEQRSGDQQGLPRSAQADSESVDELVEEGNIFEAGAVAGVEAADDADEREVRTRELPEDDVPGEYLDKD